MSDERITVVREFPVELSEGGDGRTIDAMIVPYNTPAQVADPPDFRPYMETWLPGAFEKQTRAADRVKVWLNVEHEYGIRGIVGHGVELREEPIGLHGSFRVHENSDGNKALQLVREKLLDGISLEAVALRLNPPKNGVVERVRAHLDKVSLCRNPAFKDSKVLAVRSAPVETFEPVLSPATDEALERVGIVPLQRMSVTRKPWDGAPSRFSDEEYQLSCLFDRGGDASPKERCSLPVLEPNGDLNANALGAAVARLNQIMASSELKAGAARKLMRFYRIAEMQAPDSVKKIATR